MQLQRATPTDAEDIAELDLLLFDREAMGPSSFRQELTVGWGMVLRHEGELIGYVLVRPGVLHDLTRLGIHPDWRRRGLGGDLFQAALTHHPGPMMLFVRKYNRMALRMYQQAGFQVRGATEDSWLLRAP